MASSANSNAGPSGRSPFPPARNGRSRLSATGRSSIGEDHSPFQGLLRFSPNQSSGWSPRSRNRFFADQQEQQPAVKEPPTHQQQDSVMHGIPLDQLRIIATRSLLEAPTQAVFYASIIYSKTKYMDDALLLSQAYYSAHNYTSCLRILEESSLLLSDQPWEALLLAAQALVATEDWAAVQELLEDACRLPASNHNAFSFRSIATSLPIDDSDDIGWMTLKQSIPTSSSPEVHPLARILYMRGQAYHHASHEHRAAVFYQLALKIDPACQQAWEVLLASNLINCHQAYKLIQDLEFGPEMQWLKCMYLARIELTPYQVELPSDAIIQPSATESFTIADASSIQLSSPNVILKNLKTPGLNDTVPVQHDVDEAFVKLQEEYKLDESPQVLAMAARRAFRRYDWKHALEYCQSLANMDPAMHDTAFVYVITLLLLGHKRTLFQLAHEWVEAAPKAAQSWFAVGAYYYCCERYHVSQRHFCRATRLDPSCTEAWIAFGCSFAACDESDQALASFRAAQRLSPGEYTPLLYMGMEYVRTNHLVLASYFLQAALKTSGGDPLCMHELGVLAIHKNEHDAAIGWFQKALMATADGDSVEDSIEGCQDSYWEPTLFNLGHSYRKTRQFDKAIQCFARCVALCPQKYSTYSALAFSYHLMGDLDRAIEYYHQALGCKSDDPFSTEMLHRALEEALSTSLSLQGDTAAGPKLDSEVSFISPRNEASRASDNMAIEEMDESDMDMTHMS